MIGDPVVVHLVLSTVARDVRDFDRSILRDENVACREIVVKEVLLREIDHSGDDL